MLSDLDVPVGVGPPAEVADDGGVTTLDAAEGLVDAGADAGTYCASLTPAPTFCVDFDTADPLAALGTTVTYDPICQVLVDDVASTSAPRSLVTRCGAKPSQNYAHVKRSRQLPVITTGFVVDFDLRVEAQDDQEVAVLEIELFGAAGRDAITLRTQRTNGLRALEAASVDGSTVQTFTSPLPLKKDGFSHVNLSVRKTNDGTTATLTIDNAETSKKWRTHDYFNAPDLAVGLVYLAKTDAEWRVRYDNLSFRVE